MEQNSVFQEMLQKKVYTKEETRNQILQKAHKMYKHQVRKKVFRFAASAAALLLIITVVGFHTNEAFAKQLEQIPVVRYIVKIFTGDEETIKEDFGTIHMVTPEISYPENRKLEKKMNQCIKNKLQERLAFQEKDCAEFKKNYMAMGENQVFHPITVDYSYETFCTNEKILSFAIDESEDYGIYDEPFVTRYLYNIDLTTGKQLTLEDMLGINYKKIADEQIDQQMKERWKSDQRVLNYYEEYYTSKVDGISEDQKFYINEENQVVIFFYEYEIAPDYVGDQSFIIQKK